MDTQITSQTQDYLRMQTNFDFIFNSYQRRKASAGLAPVLSPIVLMSSIASTASDLNQFKIGSVLGTVNILCVYMRVSLVSFATTDGRSNDENHVGEKLRIGYKKNN
jgi:hypothetical protein